MLQQFQHFKKANIHIVFIPTQNVLLIKIHVFCKKIMVWINTFLKEYYISSRKKQGTIIRNVISRTETNFFIQEKNKKPN